MRRRCNCNERNRAKKIPKTLAIIGPISILVQTLYSKKGSPTQSDSFSDGSSAEHRSHPQTNLNRPWR